MRVCQAAIGVAGIHAALGNLAFLGQVRRSPHECRHDGWPLGVRIRRTWQEEELLKYRRDAWGDAIGRAGSWSLAQVRRRINGGTPSATEHAS